MTREMERFSRIALRYLRSISDTNTLNYARSYYLVLVGDRKYPADEVGLSYQDAEAIRLNLDNLLVKSKTQGEAENA
jgi:hypothetical protein